MATGETRTINTDLTLSYEYEMTKYDDILNIINATITLLRPAGELFTDEGNDTVTVTGSTITAPDPTPQVRFYLGSGDDKLILQDTTVDATTLMGSGNDSVVIAGNPQSKVILNKLKDEEEKTLSLGTGNDVLELRAILAGDGDVTFGTGTDTLCFNGGSLLTTGSFGTFSILDIMVAGGTLGRDLTLAGENTQIILNGALFSTEAGKVITIADSSTILTTADNIRTDVTLNLSNVTLTQSDSGTLELSGHSGYAITANNSTVTLHDIVTQSGQVFTGENTIWKIKDSEFANSTNGIDLTGGSIELNNVGMSSYTRTTLNLNGTRLTGAHLAFTNNENGAIIASKTDIDIINLRMHKNKVYTAGEYAYGVGSNAYNYISANGTSTLIVYPNAAGGGINHVSGNLTLTSANFSGNMASIRKSNNSPIVNYGYDVTTIVCASAAGGGINHVSGNLILTSANFSGNMASAYILHTTAIASANSLPSWYSGSEYVRSANATVYASAAGGGINHVSGNLTLTSANFSGNIASVSANSVTAIAAGPGSSMTYASAAGGGINHVSGNLTLTSANFSGNIASAYSPWCRCSAAGGGINHVSGNLTLTSANFSGNMVEADSSAAGGGVYCDNAIVNSTNSNFQDNITNSHSGDYGYGGAIYLSLSTLNYLVTSGTKLSNTGNQAKYGGFLYITQNSTANLLVEEKASLTIGDDTNNDSIAGDGLIQKQGSGYLLINSDIFGYTGLWTVYEGTLELARISRNIKLDNWTFGENALVILSNQNDTINMTVNKKISTLDLGGGSDVINTNGYALSNGELRISKLKFTGGGRVSSIITNRSKTSGFDLTLDDVVLDSNINGNSMMDQIAITQASTLGGVIDLGSGDNIITGTANTTFKKSLTLGSGNDELSFTTVIFEDAVILGDGNNSLTVSDNATFSKTLAAGSGVDTLSFADVTFSNAVNFGDGTNNLSAIKAAFKNTLTTGNGNDTLIITDAKFSDKVSLGAGNDTLTFGNSDDHSGYVTAMNEIDLGDGDNNITAYGMAEFTGITAGNGCDIIDLYQESTINGELALGQGKNIVYVENCLTMTDGAVKIEKGGETRIIVYRGTTLTDNILTVYSDADAAREMVTMSWADQTELDKVRLVVSSDSTFETFEFAVELYNKSKSFTLDLQKGYFVQFQANDEDGWKQRLLDDNIAPDQVTGVEFNGKTLTWDVTHDNLGGNGVKQYTVEVATDNGFANIVQTKIISQTEYAPDNLGDETYYFRVKAEDYTNNFGEWSTTVSGQLDNTAPSRVTGGQSNVNGYDVTFSWNAASDSGSGVKEYEYRVASDNTFDSVILSDTTTELNFNTDNLAYGTYYWQVRAIDNAGNTGDWSLCKSVKTQDLVAPSVPENVDYGLDGSTLTVIWDASSDDSLGSGMDKYQVQLASDSSFTAIIKTVIVNTNEALLSNLADGDYYLRVGALDKAGNQSAWSSTLNLTVETPDINPPTNPAGLSVSIDKHTANLSWTASTDDKSGIAYYEIEVSQNTDFSGSSSMQSTMTSVTQNLNDGIYYWRVCSVDNAGNKSVYVKGTSFTIDTIAPAKPTAKASITAPTNKNVTVTAAFSADSAVKEYSRNNSDWYNYTEGIVFEENGTVYFRGTDAAGNISDVTTYTVDNIDKDAPVITRTDKYDGKWSKDDVTITASVADDYSGLATESSLSKKVTGEGKTTVELYAKDKAGNDVKETVEVLIDKTAPVVKAAADETVMTNKNVSVSATFEDDHLAEAGKFYAVNDGTWAAYASAIVFTENGKVQFKGVDEAGNETIVTYEVNNIDKDAPVMSGDVSVAFEENTAILDWNDAADIGKSGVQGYEFRYGKTSDLNGSSEILNTSTVTLADLEYGQTYFYQVRSFDKAGNYSDWMEVQSFEVPVLKPMDLQGSQSGLNWKAVTGATGYIVEYSQDNFEHTIQIEIASNEVDSFSLPQGNWQWRVRANNNTEWMEGETIQASPVDQPQLLQSDEDTHEDLFFMNTNGVWEAKYAAQHLGTKDGWSGTEECIKLEGKNVFADIAAGSDDANILVMTDDANGDALFVDDIYTTLPGTVSEQQSRIAQIDEIRAGDGDDIVDMTSQRFEYTGKGVIIRGGNGHDTIWANNGDNKLFGDAGNDRIVGADGNDVIAGGSGDDSMHGGGGSDIFCFCKGWGTDTVEQLSDGAVTLWFESGSSDKWNKTTMTYTDGNNTVTVTGVSEVTLKFGDDQSELYKDLVALDAFADKTSEKIFEEKDKSLVTSSK